MTLGGAAVAGGMIAFAKNAVAMGLEARKADNRLNAVARSMGLLDDVLLGGTQRILDYADSLERTTGIAAETTKAGQSILLTFNQVAQTAGDAGGIFDRATAAHFSFLLSIPAILGAFIINVEDIGGAFAGESGLAYLLGAATGVPLGMYMGWNRTFDKVVKPVFEVLRPTPPIAWIPIAILWFGIGEGPKIFICYVGAFVIFVLNSYTGMRYTDPLLIAAARTYGATRRQQLFNVAIPASMRSVFSGVQNALRMSWMCVLAAELVGAREGVGYLIIQGMDMYKPPMIMVGMIIIGIIGASLAVILRRFERVVCPWRRDLT
jgi:NitT/TauT family transport system permease protein/sulfonate transport system permease protein